MDINETTQMGRLGQDVEFRTTTKGDQVASFSLATDTGFVDKESRQWVPRLNWHRVVVFHQGLMDLLERRGKKGQRVLVRGELSYSSWRKAGEETDRLNAEIILDRINFIDPEK